MDYTFFITVHVYGEEKLDDSVLVRHSKNYGVCGKEIIASMRKINGREFTICNVFDNFTVRDLWHWIIYKFCGDYLIDRNGKNISLYNATEKYLIFNDLRYKVDDPDKPLSFYLHRMQMPEEEIIKIQFLVCSDEGEAFTDDGIRYYMHSKEASRHHCPHVHVDIRHECSGTFSLKTGEIIYGNITCKKYLTKIKKTILNRQMELIEFWNEHTDGLTVDLNQFLGLIEY